jgi:hypothetical protein
MSNKQKKLALVVGVSLLALLVVAALGLPFGNFDSDGETAAAYEGSPVSGWLMVRVNASASLAYESPSFSSPVVVDLSKDAGNNGWDTHIVWRTFTDDADNLWYGLRLGDGAAPVWVPAAVTYACQSITDPLCYTG